jgi:hypothetical protein
MVSRIRPTQSSNRSLSTFGMAAVLAFSSPMASADEADAKRVLKAMSDYMAGQATYSFDYDATLEVVTSEGQVLGIASSGQLTAALPDKIHVTRKGGFANTQMNFDGTTLTVFGENLNVFAQVEIPGTVQHLIDELKDTYHRPLPAADLLLPDSYSVLMEGVSDVKDLGSGVIGGVECDSLAFRAAEVDWQIWIAHGDQPYPCRFTITSKTTTGGPQYNIQLSNWKTGSDVASRDFSFKNTTGAEQIDLDSLEGAGELPEIFVEQEGGSK